MYNQIMPMKMSTCDANWSFYDWLFRRPATYLKGEFLDEICETCENIDNLQNNIIESTQSKS